MNDVGLLVPDIEKYKYIISQVVPSVYGIYFKDLKQTLRKEQCDVSLLYICH